MSDCIEKAKQARSSSRREFSRKLRQLRVQIEDGGGEGIREDLAELKAAFSQLTTHHEDLLCLLDDSQADIEDRDFFRPLEDDYLKCRASARKELQAATHLDTTTSTNARSSGSSVANLNVTSSGLVQDNTTTANNVCNENLGATATFGQQQSGGGGFGGGVSAHLERMKVPSFDGNIRKYIGWRDVFQSMTAGGETDAVTLLRLKGSMIDRARGCIDGFTTCKAAWDQLDARYGNISIIAKTLLDDIRSIKPIRHDDWKRFDDFANQVREFLSKMKEIGADGDNLYVLGDLEAKLELDDVRMFNREHPVFKSVQSFSEWLDRESNVRSFSKRAQVSSQNLGTGPSHFKALSVQGHDPGKVQNNKPADSSAVKSCWLCSGPHKIYDCKTFLNASVNERQKLLQDNNACFCCLGLNHRRVDCFRKRPCGKNGCAYQHHSLLHRDDFISKTNVNKPTAASFSSNTNALLPVVKVTVYNNHGDGFEALALLDSGSQQSLISKSLSRKLDLKGKSTMAEFSLAGGALRNEKSRVVDVKLANSFADDVQFNVSCFELTTVCANVRPFNLEEINRSLPREIGQVHHGGGVVDLLLGVDIPEVHTDLEVCRSDAGLIAKRTPLGWVIIGDQNKVKSRFSVNHVRLLDHDEIPNLAEFFDSESMGVHPTKCQSCTDKGADDIEFDKRLTESCVNVDGHYEVRLPWKGDPSQLENNFSVAMKRLENTERQLRNNPKVFKFYKEQIDALVENGYAKEVHIQNESEIKQQGCWFLPHHVIIREDKESTPYRIVFDSAASYKGLSLNDLLLKGPNYTNSIFDVFIHFQECKIAVAGDIKKMFHQIRMHPDDQVFHRFLWRDCDSSRTPKVYQMTRVTFGDRPSPDISGYVMKRIADDFAGNKPKVADVIKHSRYVDDICESGVDPAEMSLLTKDIDNALNKGGFSIKKWNSNAKLIDAENNEMCNVLGYRWFKGDDKISLRKKNDSDVTGSDDDVGLLTKRKIFGTVASHWDPLGLTTAVSIKAKIQLQNLWRLGFSWDEKVGGHDWFPLFRELKMVGNVKFERCLKPPGAEGLPQLHGFADASENAYGACVFLRWSLKEGGFKSTFVASKAHVAPLKAQTIPRYELMGCTLLTRLVDTVHRALRTDLEQVVLWSDSTTALAWIRSQSRDYKPFVQTRVGEIQRTFSPSCWRYVPSASNPADELTKGIELDALYDWHQGPTFLKLDEDHWHEQPRPAPSSLATDSERKKGINVVVVSSPVIDVSRFSSWNRLRNSTAFVFRFCNNARSSEAKQSGPLKPSELDAAELHIFKCCQVGLDVNHEAIQRLTTFTDSDGLIRVKGRLSNADLSYNQRHPILLPKDSHASVLLVRHLHHKLGHSGHQRLVAEVQQRFWIIGINRLCKSIVRECVVCRKCNSKAREQFMADLPNFRVEPNTPAFYHSSVDYFGPLKVVYSKNSTVDAFGCIFTCLVTRAVHLEMVMDASSQSFLNAWRRFAAIRGHSRLIISDNGTNFVGAQKFIKDIIAGWNAEEIQQFGVGKMAEFEWRFLAPGASHHNGAVERMIRSVRSAITKTCGYAKCREEEWRTYLAEVGNLINSRPLYPASSSVLDDCPITPNSLLIGHNNVEVPQVYHVEDFDPRNRFLKVQKLVNEFWASWMRHYVSSLIPRNKWWKQREDAAPGDIVLIIDSSTPRGRWRLAVVEEVKPSKDGRVRTVKLRTADHKIIVRPISKTCLLLSVTELVVG